MKSIYNALVVIAGIFIFAACSPDMYTGGGWAPNSQIEDGTARFGFSVEHCHEGALGCFDLQDDNWRVPVEMNGHVMGFGESDGAGFDCGFFATLDYVSADEDHPGEGRAVVCFENGEEPTGAGLIEHIHITVQSGPYEGYENHGPIYVHAQSHECDG